MDSELKQAFKGQIGNVGMKVAAVHWISEMSSKSVMQHPVQVCIRIEQEESERLQEYANKRGLKLISLCGGILQAAIEEFLEYDNSFKVLEVEEAEHAVALEKARQTKEKSRSSKKSKVALDLTE